MDKKRGFLNVGAAVGFKIVLLVGSVLVRRFLIKYLGIEVNGLNSLYLSIIGFLAVAELGIGSAIVFCMYKPIVDREEQKVIALYRLIEKLYRIIGAFILAAGLIVMPFLPYLAKGYSISHSEMYVTFVIMLVSVVITYFYSARVSLLEAYKNNYIVTTIASSATIVQYVLQIAAVIIFKTFYAYLACRIIAVLIQWVLLWLYTSKHNPEIVKHKARIDAGTAAEVSKNVRAMFMHKIGAVLVNTADSIIISAFIGVVVLGGYSNYTSIMTSMTAILILFFTPLTSTIGHEFAKDNNESLERYFRFFHAFNYALGLIFFLGYYAVIDDVVLIFFGEGLKLSRAIVFIITYNYLIQFMRNAVVMFRDAAGTFYFDRWKSLIEGIINVILSIVFVLVFPEEYKVVGVIVATIITNLLVSHIIEPYMLFKHGMKRPASGYYIRNYLWIVIFAGALFVLDKLMVSLPSPLLDLLANGGIAVGIAAVLCIALAASEKDFRYYLRNILKRPSRQKESK